VNFPTVFSPDRVYRYTLWRRWDETSELFKPEKEWSCTKCGADLDKTEDHQCAFRFVQFIGLNPSTADETNDDPTIRRCIRYSKDWGYDGYCMTNLFAFRATDPKVMKSQPSPIGPDNDTAIMDIAMKAALIVCAWGTHGAHRHRGMQVKGLLRSCLGLKIHHLGLTKENFPKHPLYLHKGIEPIEWKQ